MFHISNSISCFYLCLGLCKWIWNKDFKKVQVHMSGTGRHITATLFLESPWIYSKLRACVQCSCFECGFSSQVSLSQIDLQCGLDYKGFPYITYTPLQKWNLFENIVLSNKLITISRGPWNSLQASHMECPPQLVQVSWAHLLSFANNSSHLFPCILYIYTGLTVFKEFLEKGGDLKLKSSQIPQLAHTRRFMCPVIGSGRSWPCVYKV